MSYPTNYREWLAKLVSFDTTSRNSNLELINYVKAYFESVGVKPAIVYNPKKTHANLWATLPGEGGATQGGIIFSGHTDVVPVDGQKWDSDPFKTVEKDGKIYGRGTCDMKGYLAVALALAPTFLSMKRAKPVHYAFSFNEEVGCTGVPFMIEYLKEKGFKADGCIIGEPTSLKVFIANKGWFSWNISVFGKAIHSSMALMNTSCNAIEYAAQIIAKIRAIAEDLKKNGPQDPSYNCPFCAMSTGLVQGGNAVNTVPAQCDFVVSIRVVDSQTAKDVDTAVRKFVNETILPAMRVEYPEADVKVESDYQALAFNGKADDPFTKLICELCEDPKTYKVGGATEAGFFQHVLGIPTVIAGPGPMLMAHCANEYVLVEDMDRTQKVLTEAVRRWTTAGSQNRL